MLLWQSKYCGIQEYIIWYLEAKAKTIGVSNKSRTDERIRAGRVGWGSRSRTEWACFFELVPSRGRSLVLGRMTQGENCTCTWYVTLGLTWTDGKCIGISLWWCGGSLHVQTQSHLHSSWSLFLSYMFRLSISYIPLGLTFGWWCGCRIAVSPCGSCCTKRSREERRIFPNCIVQSAVQDEVML